MVERSIAWLVRGSRRVPWRGVEKNTQCCITVPRLLTYDADRTGGLTDQNGTWVLA